MFVRIVHHWCNGGCVDLGRAHIDEVGALAANAPGFVQRFRMESSEDPLLLSTMTVWRDKTDFTNFCQSTLPGDPKHVASLFERTREEIFTVVSINQPQIKAL